MILPDLLTDGLNIVFCGTAPSDKSAERKAYYAGAGNLFYPTLASCGFTPKILKPEEFPELLNYKIGLTDLVKLHFGMDKDLKREHFDTKSFEEKILKYQPKLVCFNGKESAKCIIRKEFMDAFDKTSIEAIKKAHPLNYQIVCAEYDDKANGSFNPEYASQILADLCKNGSPEAYRKEDAPADPPMSKNSKGYVNKPPVPEKQPNHLKVQEEVAKSKQKGLNLSKPVPTGLHIWANCCGGRYLGTCLKGAGATCQVERHRYRLEINHPATVGRIFITQPFTFLFDEKKAKEIAIRERARIIGQGGKVAITEQEQEKEAELDYSIVEVLMQKHISYLRDEGKETFEKRHLFENWIERTEKIYNFMTTVIKEIGLNPAAFHSDQFTYKIEEDVTVIGILYDSITHVRGNNGKIKNHTINNYLKAYKTLYEWGIKNKFITDNPFKEIQLKKVNANRNVRKLTETEFIRFSEDVISKKDILKEYESGNKHFYRPFLLDTVKLALYSAIRNMQAAQLRWSNILMEGDQLVNSIIEVEDYKTNNQYKLFDEETKSFNYVRINHDLAELLIALNFKENRFMNNFILEPTSLIQRDTLISQASRSFREYMRDIAPDRSIKFKHLRKTHISAMSEAVGLERASKVFHEDCSVTRANYVHFKSIIPTAAEFGRIF